MAFPCSQFALSSWQWRMGTLSFLIPMPCFPLAASFPTMMDLYPFGTKAQVNSSVSCLGYRILSQQQKVTNSPHLSLSPYVIPKLRTLLPQTPEHWDLYAELFLGAPRFPIRGGHVTSGTSWFQTPRVSTWPNCVLCWQPGMTCDEMTSTYRISGMALKSSLNLPKTELCCLSHLGFICYCGMTLASLTNWTQYISLFSLLLYWILMYYLSPMKFGEISSSDTMSYFAFDTMLCSNWICWKLSLDLVTSCSLSGSHFSYCHPLQPLQPESRDTFLIVLLFKSRRT